MTESKLETLKVEALGDCALLIRVGPDASGETAQRVHAVVQRLLMEPLAGVLDVVGAVCTVALHYDPLRIEAMPDAETPFDALAQQVTRRLSSFDPATADPAAEHDIPVCYGGEFGEDLEAVARTHGVTEEEVIALHTAPLYRVQMLGFAPGFAYLAGLDARIATPRKATPRTRVPAGSVGIGGELTAVYPLDLPGGWHLIGRSPVRFFVPTAERPSLLVAGDRVRFRPVTTQEYGELERDARWR
ncbi:MAG TPA: 5-oxoprolinase subunit PxpB [Burkholderiales bacterium]|nr:5-oxoprolinase subunit PxpB [Burkholderiales bacterium]